MISGTSIVTRQIIISSIEDESERKGLNYQIAALNLAVLCLASSIGGMIADVWGRAALFAIDTVTYIIASIFCFAALTIFEKRLALFKASSRPSIASKFDLNRAISGSLWLIMIWSGIGCAHQMIEFPIFESRKYSQTFIGIATGVWGMGSLFSLLPFIKIRSYSLKSMAAAFSMTIPIFLLPVPRWLVLLSFFMAGILHAGFTGALRSYINEHILKNKLPSGLIWSSVQMHIAIANLLTYSLGLILVLTWSIHAVALLFLAALCLLVWQTLQVQCSIWEAPSAVPPNPSLPYVQKDYPNHHN